MEAIQFVERVDLRNQCIGRVEVLDKVKALFLIPGLLMATTKQVAEFYEAPVKSIQTTYLRNRAEIDEDGTQAVKAADFSPLQDETDVSEGISNRLHLEGDWTSIKNKAMTTYTSSDGFCFSLHASGTKCFSKRAILRIGMLLRDSPIAQEVRTQLLNTFENSTVEQRVKDIDEEITLQADIGKAMVSGDIMEIGKACAAAFAFKNRHIASLEEGKRMLTAEILEWGDRAKINKAVRIAAAKSGHWHGAVWNKLYDELLYKQGISLAMRGSGSRISHIRENEWTKVQKSFAAICEDMGLDVSSIVQAAKIEME